MAAQQMGPTDPEEEKKDIDLIEQQFAQIDRMDFEAFDFGEIDPNESMRVDLDDYSIIMTRR